MPVRCRTPTTPSKRIAPAMLTTDLALRLDPAYEKISRRFLEHPEQFADAFARAWFKLTHRDMGPRARYLGPEVPEEELVWQDPIPALNHHAHRCAGHRRRSRRRSSPPALRCRSWLPPHGPRPPPSVALTSAAVRTARAFASRRRRTGRSTSRSSSRRVLKTLEAHPGASSTSAQAGGKKVSLADLIVLGGCAGAIEQAAKTAGQPVTVPFTPGRMDATQEQTDTASFNVLEPVADGFRNYQKTRYAVPAEALLLDRAQLLTLTAPEMTVLIGGPARAEHQYRAAPARGAYPAPGRPDQRLLQEPARHGNGVEGDLRGQGDLRGTRPQERRARSGRRPASTWCSARTRSCVRWRRSTAVPTRRRASYAISWQPGPR